MMGIVRGANKGVAKTRVPSGDPFFLVRYGISWEHSETLVHVQLSDARREVMMDDTGMQIVPYQEQSGRLRK